MRVDRMNGVRVMRCDSMMIVVVQQSKCKETRGREKKEDRRRIVLQRLNDDSRIVHPRTVHIERDHLRYRHEVLTTKRTAQQPKRQILFLASTPTLLPLFSYCELGGGMGPSLSDASRPIGHHIRATRAIVQLAETVRGENKEGVGADASMENVRFGRDVRWGSISG